MRRFALIALPATLALAACGGGDDITVTNDNNVVLNEAHANVAFTNDGEMGANDTMMMSNDMGAMNGTDPAMMNGATPTGNAM